MGDPPRVSDYITPAPPFMAGTNVLNKAITDIWAKRQEDEKVRILAAQQAATQAYQQGELGNVRDAHAETRRHQMADEAHNMGVLDKDNAKQRMEYIDKVVTAYNSGNRQVGAGLAANAHLFGIAPQAMAAIVAHAQPGAGAAATGVASGSGDWQNQGADVNPFTPDGAVRGPVPGSAMAPTDPATVQGGGPPAPDGTEGAQGDSDAVPNATATMHSPPVLYPQDPSHLAYPRLVPPDPLLSPINDPNPLPPDPALAKPQLLGAPVQAQPSAPQPDLNTPQAPVPAQGPPAAPSTSGPVPTPGSPMQAAPGPSMPPPDQQTRREDIHNQPRPPGQLGIPSPVDPRTPPRLPEMPYANDPSKNPIALGAEPGRDADVPTPAGGAAPSPASMPGAPGNAGGVDAATRQRWLARGVAGTAVMPDGDAIMAANAQDARELMTRMTSQAADADELGIINAAIETAAARTAMMSPKEAAIESTKEAMDMIRLHRQDLRTNMMAAGAEGRAKELRQQREAENAWRHEQQAEVEARHREQMAAQQAEQARVEARHREQMATQKEQFTRQEEERASTRFVTHLKEALHDNGVASDLVRIKSLERVEKEMSGPISSIDWTTVTRDWMRIMGEKGASSDKDAMASEGVDHLSLIEKFQQKIAELTSGISPERVRDLRDLVHRQQAAMLDRTEREYSRYRQQINDSAPNDRAKQEGRTELEFGYQNYPFGPARFQEDREAEAKTQAEWDRTHKADGTPLPPGVERKPPPKKGGR